MPIYLLTPKDHSLHSPWVSSGQKNWAPPSTCERRRQPTVCREKKWNSLTDVLVVLSALIINRWEKGPIYQSGEKLIDTGFDFIAVTCCLDASQLFFLFRFQGKVFDSTGTPKKSFFRALSPRHEQRDICLPTHTRRHKITYVEDCCPVTSPLCSRYRPRCWCHWPGLYVSESANSV